jgi:hypothetical protein
MQKIDRKAQLNTEVLLQKLNISKDKYDSMVMSLDKEVCSMKGLGKRL